jgi:hypothetical protein
MNEPPGKEKEGFGEIQEVRNRTICVIQSGEELLSRAKVVSRNVRQRVYKVLRADNPEDSGFRKAHLR